MTDSGDRRVYRIRALGIVLAALLPLALGAAALVYDIASDDTVPGWVPLLVGLFFVAFFGLAVWLIVGTATIADDKHLTVRGMFKSRAYPWREIQAIELEPNPQAAYGGNQPTVLGVLYDATGKRIGLPYLNDRGTPDVEREVAELQEAWRQRRGHDWEQSAVITAEVERHQRPPRTPASLIALLVGGAVFLLGVLVVVLLLISGAYAKIGEEESFVVDTLLTPMPVMLILPAAAYVITLVVVLVRRRQSSDQASAAHSS